MIKLMTDGGPGMWAILILGLIGLGTAAWFAWRAESRVRGFLDSLSRSVGYATLVSLSLDLMKTLFFVAQHAPPEQKAMTLMQGLGESMAPLLLGSVLLCLIHLLTAIGQRRVDARAG